MQGAQAAAPIWGEFMKRAVQLPQYSDTREFAMPTGVTLVRLDKTPNLLADESCPDDYTAAFLDGTAPATTCDQPANDQRNIFQKIFGIGHEGPNSPPGAQQPGVAAEPVQPQPGAPLNTTQQPTPQQPAQEEKKPGFFGKLFGHKPKTEPAPQP